MSRRSKKWALVGEDYPDTLGHNGSKHSAKDQSVTQTKKKSTKKTLSTNSVSVKISSDVWETEAKRQADQPFGALALNRILYSSESMGLTKHIYAASQGQPLTRKLHPNALIRDPGRFTFLLAEIPYCLQRTYSVMQSLIDKGDSASMFTYGSCIVYLTSFCARIAHENRDWFSQPFPQQPFTEAQANKETLSMRLTAKPEQGASPLHTSVLSPSSTNSKYHSNGLGKKKLLENASFSHVIPETIGEAIVRVVQNNGLLWSSQHTSRIWPAIDLAEGARGIDIIPGIDVPEALLQLVKSCDDMQEWQERELRASKNSRWSDLTLVVTLQWCIAKNVPELFHYVIREVLEHMPRALGYLVAPKKTKAKKKPSIQQESGGEGVAFAESVVQRKRGTHVVLAKKHDDNRSCAEHLQSSLDQCIGFANSGSCTSHITEPTALKVTDESTSTQKQSKLITSIFASGDSKMDNFNEAESLLTSTELSVGEAIHLSSGRNSDSKQVRIKDDLSNIEDFYDWRCPSREKELTVSAASAARVYCVTHIILVLSEFGSRPILREHCTDEWLDSLASMLADWLVELSTTYPSSHMYNRELVVEIAASLLICKHNGVLLGPATLAALRATNEILINDGITRGAHLTLRNAGTHEKQNVYVPIIPATQSRTEKGARFCDYHTHYLVGMYFQLLIADTFGGCGQLNCPESQVMTESEILYEKTKAVKGTSPSKSKQTSVWCESEWDEDEEVLQVREALGFVRYESVTVAPTTKILLSSTSSFNALNLASHLQLSQSISKDTLVSKSISRPCLATLRALIQKIPNVVPRANQELVNVLLEAESIRGKRWRMATDEEKRLERQRVSRQNVSFAGAAVNDEPATAALLGPESEPFISSRSTRLLYSKQHSSASELSLEQRWVLRDRDEESIRSRHWWLKTPVFVQTKLGRTYTHSHFDPTRTKSHRPSVASKEEDLVQLKLKLNSHRLQMASSTFEGYLEEDANLQNNAVELGKRSRLSAKDSECEGTPKLSLPPSPPHIQGKHKMSTKSTLNISKRLCTDANLASPGFAVPSVVSNS